MAREPDANGTAYLRTYRSLDGVVTYERFAEVCEAQGLPKPAKRMFDHVRSLYRDGQPHYIAINTYDQMRKARREQWTADRVNRLVTENQVETERLDFKQELGNDSTTKKPWAAMANSGGGDVVYGVAEVDSKADHIERVSFDGIEERIQQLNQAIDPPVNLSVSQVPVDGDDGGVVCVRVSPAAPGTVHMVDHRAPIRSGTTTRYMTSEEIRRWIREAKRPSAPDL